MKLFYYKNISSYFKYIYIFYFVLKCFISLSLSLSLSPSVDIWEQVALAVLQVTMLQIQDPPLAPVAVLVTQQPILASLHALLVLLASTQPPLVLPDAPVAQLVSIHQQPGRLLQTLVSTVQLIPTVLMTVQLLALNVPMESTPPLVPLTALLHPHYSHLSTLLVFRLQDRQDDLPCNLLCILLCQHHTLFMILPLTLLPNHHWIQHQHPLPPLRYTLLPFPLQLHHTYQTHNLPTRQLPDPPH
jgi:hypothetical protein